MSTISENQIVRDTSQSFHQMPQEPRIQFSEVKMPDYVKLRQAPSEEYRVANLPIENRPKSVLSTNQQQLISFNNIKHMFGLVKDLNPAAKVEENPKSKQELLSYHYKGTKANQQQLLDFQRKEILVDLDKAYQRVDRKEYHCVDDVNI